MANQVTNYKCPACTGPLHFVGESGKLECEYCGSVYEVNEIEKMMETKEEDAAKAMEAADLKAEKKKESGESEDWGTEGMKAYTCPSCGAELICDSNTAATCCPYCGNPTIVPGQFSGSKKPDYVIPFKLGKDKAIAKLKEHYQGKVLLPSSFAEGNHINEVQGVYVPFWLCDGVVEADASYDAKIETTRTQGDYKITTTKHYRSRRAGSISFEKIPVDASTKMPDGHMDAIEPFDYKELKPFSNAYMPGYLADKYDVSAKESRKRADERGKASAFQELEKSLQNMHYTSHYTTSSQADVKKAEEKYAMLPVWMLSTQWEGKNYLFAMNGQTGKLVGDLPMDMKKFWMWFALILLPVTAVMYFILDSILIGAVIGLIAAGIVCLILKGQLTSAVTQSRADEYVAGGLKLSKQEDVYINTTEQRVKIEKKEESN